MSDNFPLTPGSGRNAATDEVSYSGDTADVQLVRFVQTTGSEGAKTVVDLPGDASNGLDVDVTRTVEPPTVTGSGSLTATSQAVTLTLAGRANSTFQLTGTWTATVQFEGTNDGTNWTTIYALRAGDNTISQTVVNSTNNDIYRCTTAGFHQVRCTCTAYTSGTVVVTAIATGRTSGVFLNFPLPGVAHDSPDSGAPIKVGMKAVAHGANPTAVTAADRTDWYANRHGVPFVIGGHPNSLSATYLWTGATTDDNVLPAISAGTKYAITRITITIDQATTVGVAVRLGFGTASVPTLPAANADAVNDILFYHPGMVPGSGANVGDGSGILGVGPDGAELRITAGATTGGTGVITVTYFTIES